MLWAGQDRQGERMHPWGLPEPSLPSLHDPTKHVPFPHLIFRKLDSLRLTTLVQSPLLLLPLRLLCARFLPTRRHFAAALACDRRHHHTVVYLDFAAYLQLGSGQIRPTRTAVVSPPFVDSRISLRTRVRNETVHLGRFASRTSAHFGSHRYDRSLSLHQPIFRPCSSALSIWARRMQPCWLCRRSQALLSISPAMVCASQSRDAAKDSD